MANPTEMAERGWPLATPGSLSDCVCVSARYLCTNYGDATYIPRAGHVSAYNTPPGYLGASSTKLSVYRDSQMRPS